jgi:hypothetical protein
MPGGGYELARPSLVIHGVREVLGECATICAEFKQHGYCPINRETDIEGQDNYLTSSFGSRTLKKGEGQVCFGSNSGKILQCIPMPTKVAERVIDEVRTEIESNPKLMYDILMIYGIDDIDEIIKYLPSGFNRDSRMSGVVGVAPAIALLNLRLKEACARFNGLNQQSRDIIATQQPVTMSFRPQAGDIPLEMTRQPRRTTSSTSPRIPGLPVQRQLGN